MRAFVVEQTLDMKYELSSILWCLLNIKAVGHLWKTSFWFGLFYFNSLSSFDEGTDNSRLKK